MAFPFAGRSYSKSARGFPRLGSGVGWFFQALEFSVRLFPRLGKSRVKSSNPWKS
jgi:hypothetical protein